MPRTVSQPEQALAHANRVRSRMAFLKACVADGTVTVGEALEHPDAGPVRLYDLLRAQRGWGEVRATRVMRRLGVVSATRQVRDLTPRQRAQVRELVAEEGLRHE